MFNFKDYLYTDMHKIKNKRSMSAGRLCMQLSMRWLPGLMCSLRKLAPLPHRHAHCIVTILPEIPPSPTFRQLPQLIHKQSQIMIIWLIFSVLPVVNFTLRRLSTKTYISNLYTYTFEKIYLEMLSLCIRFYCTFVPKVMTRGICGW